MDLPEEQPSSDGILILLNRDPYPAPRGMKRLPVLAADHSHEAKTPSVFLLKLRRGFSRASVAGSEPLISDLFLIVDKPRSAPFLAAWLGGYLILTAFSPHLHRKCAMMTP